PHFLRFVFLTFVQNSRNDHACRGCCKFTDNLVIVVEVTFLSYKYKRADSFIRTYNRSHKDGFTMLSILNTLSGNPVDGSQKLAGSFFSLQPVLVKGCIF